jgi:tetratricopeptide (TPR) repeat protein
VRRLPSGWVLCFVFACQHMAVGQEASSTQTAAPDSQAAAGQVAAGQAPETVSAEVAKAEAAIVKADYKAAEPILDSWLAAHPADARALFDAGYLADAEGRNPDAVALYRKAVAASPDSFEAQISLGLLLARMGNPSQARPPLWAAANLNSATIDPAAKARAWRALARIDLSGFDAVNSGPGTAPAVNPDPAQASIDLLEALKLSPETADDTLLAASLAEANHDDAGAESAYRRALGKNPESGVASAGLAHLLMARKKYPQAEELLAPAVKKSPDDPALTAQLAAAMVAQDKADALPLLQQFHQKHPQEAVITRMLAEVLSDAGEYAGSDQLYGTLLAASPKDSVLLSSHGQNLIRLRRYPEAVKVFERATEIDESNGEAWNGLAFASFQTHQPEITLHALTIRSKYLPESAIIYFLWATAYDTLHDKKQAAAYYHRFLDSASGKFPDQEWQARQRLALLEKAS